MSSALDVSAVLAAFKNEPGASVVAKALTEGAVMSTVNLAEVVAKLQEQGIEEELIRPGLEAIGFEVVPFGLEDAYQVGVLRASTRATGLSLGDRACIVLAGRLGIPALTADRLWTTLNLGVAVQLIR